MYPEGISQMTKLLLVNHDSGTHAYEVETDQEIKECLSLSMFAEPLVTLKPQQRLELEEDFTELADNWCIDGEQWNVELKEGCFIDWRKESRKESPK